MATPHLSRITAWPVIYACSLSCDALAQCGPSSGRAMRGCVTLKFQWLHTWLALFLGKNWVSNGTDAGQTNLDLLYL